MTTNAMINKLYKFIKNIPSDFGIDYDSGELWCISPSDYDVNYREIGWECGATKLAFVSPFCDEVIKIPFNCMLYDNYNADTNEYDDPFPEYFCRANEDGGDNYCDIEVDMYIRAKAEGLDMFFPNTRFYGRIERKPIYAQEKVQTYYNACGKTEISDDSREKVKSLTTRCGIDRDWLATAIEFTDVETVERLMNFLVENNINGDLHNNNIGFRKDGFPVILDFSNYNENF